VCRMNTCPRAGFLGPLTRQRRIGFLNALSRQPPIYRQVVESSIGINGRGSWVKIALLRGYFGSFMVTAYTTGASDFLSPPLPSSLFRLVGQCAVLRAGEKDLLGYCPCLLSGSMRPSIPGGHSRFALAPVALLPAGVLITIGPFQRGHFGTQHLHGRLYPLPLLLACFRAYASNAMSLTAMARLAPLPWRSCVATPNRDARVASLPRFRLLPNG
jgi:hypothetical protein